MLMVNEVNKRLLLMAKESQERERITMAELEEHLQNSFDPNASAAIMPQETEEPFNPHDYEPRDTSEL